jgi:predicted outer membrane repeat protein
MTAVTLLLLFSLILARSGQSISTAASRDVEYNDARGSKSHRMTKGTSKSHKSAKGKSKGKSKRSKPHKPPACTTLQTNTAQALEAAIVEANGEPLHLYATYILFEKELALDVPVHLSCQDGCVFDGGRARRLFSFGTIYFPDKYPVDYNVHFQHITFQNGRGVPIFDPPASQQGGGGGAIQFVGYETSRAKFEDCVFQDNNGTYAHNGGAIDVWKGGPMEIVRCTFANNTAHTGGAISATDISITLKDSTFVYNAVCGLAEGPAIFLGSNTNPFPDDVFVKCLAGNVFEGNLDGFCIDDCDICEFQYDIVGPSKNCGDIATP